MSRPIVGAISVEEAVEQGYTSAPPLVRTDMPAIIVGYEAISEYTQEFRTQLGDLDAANKTLRREQERIRHDMGTIRSLIADAIQLWGEGRDEEGRQKLTEAASLAASQ